MTDSRQRDGLASVMQADVEEKSQLRILLVGNHTCGNRGDAAILRGLITQLEADTTAEVTVTSRYPVSSAFLLDRPVLPDVMHGWPAGDSLALPRRLRAWQTQTVVPAMLGLASLPGWHWLKRWLPASVKPRVAWLAQFDIIIQVGGSFFVDLYGYRQFETPFASILAGRRLLLLGHSMGPFEGWLYRLLTSRLLRGAAVVSLREASSLRLMKEAGLPTKDVSEGSDTAWLVDTSISATPRARGFSSERPTVAITVRDLTPFHKRLGMSQSQYEEGFARLAEQLIDKGFDIVACSTCTGIDSYHRDDRMPALRIKALVGRSEHFHVIMDELNDVELGQLLRTCQLLVGTRLHSAIIAMNFGTTAIALNYEHKSAGVLEQLGLSDLALPVTSLLDESLASKVNAVLEDIGNVTEKVVAAVAVERNKAIHMIQAAIFHQKSGISS